MVSFFKSHVKRKFKEKSCGKLMETATCKYFHIFKCLHFFKIFAGFRNFFRWRGEKSSVHTHEQTKISNFRLLKKSPFYVLLTFFRFRFFSFVVYSFKILQFCWKHKRKKNPLYFRQKTIMKAWKQPLKPQNGSAAEEKESKLMVPPTPQTTRLGYGTGNE